MKKIFNILISALLIFSLMPFSNVSAEMHHNSKSLGKLISELIYYYGEEAHTDVLRTLDLMEEESPEDYKIWHSVIDQWDWIENEMKENLNVAPDGLPEDNKHVFVVLGFALDNNGEMKDELIGRLEVALNSANKYPDAYVLVTGGVEKNGWTEGDRMHDWLVDHGLSEDRIIVENESSNTVENASNSFDILYNDYDIDTFSMISSQYHLKRGSIFYYTMSQLKAKEFDKDPIEFLGEGNAGWYREDKTEEPWSLKIRGMYQIAGVEESKDLPISKLEKLNIEGDLEYSLNEKLNLTVYAQYDNGYQRDVTEPSDITGFNSNEIGDQELEIRYEENGKTINKNITVSVEAPSLYSMQQQVESLRDKGELADDNVARSLDVHLAAVKRFEETEQTEKVLKHLNGFQNLLDYQRDEELISDDAYDLLESNTEYLIKEASL
ncbi:YdcF family protein [Lentibacillus sp.]|uniref:YdcF family protein n=1 Tax=Lentibacillus sp. TaxID=1925746 RepID=UPI002B4B827C|nr:YdcF family protein [Lentibacillus sp.]HLS09510.1 YdcF family protein [Lentibacillus sp.]